MKYTTQERIENAIKWIDGLKGTTLKRGQGQLGDNEQGFCCLGYGCHRAKMNYRPDDPYSINFAKSIGLKKKDGMIVGGHDVTVVDDFDGLVDIINFSSLANINDETNLTFRRISTIIKKRAKDIFVKDVAEGIIKHYS